MTHDLVVAIIVYLLARLSVHSDLRVNQLSRLLDFILDRIEAQEELLKAKEKIVTELYEQNMSDQETRSRIFKLIASLNSEKAVLSADIRKQKEEITFWKDKHLVREPERTTEHELL